MINVYDFDDVLEAMIRYLRLWPEHEDAVYNFVSELTGLSEDTINELLEKKS